MQRSFVKIGLSVPEIKLGQPLENAKEIVRLAKADSKSSILLFPETCLTGHSIGDWMFNRQILIENLEAIEYILNNNLQQLLIIGTILEINSSLYNVALVIEGSRIKGIIPKQFLPRNREFSDPRFFVSGKNLLNTIKTIDLFGQSVLIGELLFNFNQGQLIFGVEVCGDMWAPISPSSLLYASGAEAIFNLSASTFNLGKAEQRLILTRSASLRGLGAYLYVSSGISETSSDIVYTGHKIAAINGEVHLNEETLDFTSTISYLDLDLDAIRYARMSSGWFHEYEPNTVRTIFCQARGNKGEDLEVYPRSCPFEPKNFAEAEKIVEVIGAALYKRLNYIGIDKVVIGISGGLDSTIALLIAYEAFKKYQIDPKQIFGFTLPSFGTKENSLNNALSLINKLGITNKNINIDQAVLDHFALIEHDEQQDITYENVQARYRTLILMNKANQLNAIVIGTSDMSEIALGWSTFNGDHMAMYGLNAGLPKTCIKYLVKYFINKYPILNDELSFILSLPISPELLPGQQNTEEIIGKYEINDFIMYHLLVNGSSKKTIVHYLIKVFALTIVEANKYYDNFIWRFKRQQYKRLTMPESVKIFEVSLSPRLDIKLPGDLS